MRKTKIRQTRELCLKKHFAVSEMGDCNSWNSQVSARVTHSGANVTNQYFPYQFIDELLLQSKRINVEWGVRMPGLKGCPWSSLISCLHSYCLWCSLSLDWLRLEVALGFQRLFLVALYASDYMDSGRKYSLKNVSQTLFWSKGRNPWRESASCILHVTWITCIELQLHFDVSVALWNIHILWAEHKYKPLVLTCPRSLFQAGAVCDVNPSCGVGLGRDCSSIVGSTLPKCPPARAGKETPIILLVIWLRGTRGSSRFKLLLNIHRLYRTSPARFCFKLLSGLDLTIKLQFQECNNLMELKRLEFFPLESIQTGFFLSAELIQ